MAITPPTAICPRLLFAQAEGKGEPELVGAVLRPGNVPGGHTAMALIQRRVARLRKTFPRCVVTNRPEGEADRLSCHRFRVNQFRLLLPAA